MKPFFITIAKNLTLLIIPDSDAHADGHPVLTYTYSIYRRDKSTLGKLNQPDKLLQVNKKNNPDYLGYITFEQPGKVFSYVADGENELSPDEVLEVIEEINHFRDTPQLWII
ncbi:MULTISPECIES: hypothetical protein [Mucilaginibacter]|jgi:hypothetical protein|uniref:hypothetical protein n=1 Tax=Mucilaginibacter TaxID=423349 RepID=UPI0008714A10|nr:MULTISPECIES: hypothetical protein [Mucilaginibacter]NVM62762.1 hypothetical protein [Mucilaginibacter sp. SG538B]GGB09554.1 hypothetical protein GCM10011500_26670 [Mucilaginibacter rubeus]SCW40680.1 hypothetical protein SAMN03159284_00363 [Mucilaginibacter sp. NFR10]